MREGRRAFGVFVRRVVGVWECVCVGRRVYERGGIAYASGGKGKENGVVWRAQMERGYSGLCVGCIGVFGVKRRDRRKVGRLGPRGRVRRVQIERHNRGKAVTLILWCF